MNKDVEMGDASKADVEGDELKQYDLDNYDEDDAVPCMCSITTCLLSLTFSVKLWVRLAISRDSRITAITTRIHTSL